MDKRIPYKIYLEEQEMPKQWYNVRADMEKKPAPILNPGGHAAAGHGGGAFRYLLPGTGKTGTGRYNPLF